jgi:hypothetical protein
MNGLAKYENAVVECLYECHGMHGIKMELVSANVTQMTRANMHQCNKVAPYFWENKA